MTLKDDLIAARALIEKGWTQGAFARTEYGVSVDPNDAGAVCWCAWGAIIASTENDADRMGDVTQRIYEIESMSSLAWINDELGYLPNGLTGRPAILWLYDEAIRRAGAA